tara:strand:+ start:580 stop:1062 length:483 start_codon:yes stop_codon:yes gene_type:complete
MPIATRSSKFDISKKKNLEKIISNILKKIKVGDAILLYGDIGVGKTTSARILINLLQKKNNLKITEVPSPTFNIVHEYLIKNILVAHYDLYRLSSKKECNNIGLNEDLNNKINIIEWPEKIQKKPIDRIELYFRYKNNFVSRSLKIKKYGRCKKYEIFKS